MSAPPHSGQPANRSSMAPCTNSSNTPVIEYIDAPFMRQRTRNFSHEETLALLEIWGDSSIQKKFESSYRHSCLWNTISQRMGQQGYNRTPVECKTKIGNLKCQYSKYRKAIQSGANPPEWPYLARFHQILTSRMTSQVPNYMNEIRDYSLLLPANSDSEKSTDASAHNCEDDTMNGGQMLTISVNGVGGSPTGSSNPLYNFPEALVSIKEEITSEEESSEVDASVANRHHNKQQNEEKSSTTGANERAGSRSPKSPCSEANPGTSGQPKRKLKSPEHVMMRKLVKLGEEALELYKKRIENETAMFTAVANFFNTMSSYFSSNCPSASAARSDNSSAMQFPFRFPSSSASSSTNAPTVSNNESQSQGQDSSSSSRDDNKQE